MIEKERKFLCWKKPEKAIFLADILQVYIVSSKIFESRVRFSKKEESKKTELTIKLRLSDTSRIELNYIIPTVIGKILTKNKKNRVYKKRYIYIDDGYIWEIDLIRKNEKLMILAELENQIYKKNSLPDFIKYEVTGLDIYSSKNLYKII